MNWSNLQGDPTVYNCSQHHANSYWDGSKWIAALDRYVGWINWLSVGSGQANGSC